MNQPQRVRHNGADTYRETTFRYVIVYSHEKDGWAVSFLLRSDGTVQGPPRSITPRWWPYTPAIRFTTRDKAKEAVHEKMPGVVHVQELKLGRT